jgi:hypothetical protein
MGLKKRKAEMHKINSIIAPVGTGKVIEFPREVGIEVRKARTQVKSNARKGKRAFYAILVTPTGRVYRTKGLSKTGMGAINALKKLGIINKKRGK